MCGPHLCNFLNKQQRLLQIPVKIKNHKGHSRQQTPVFIMYFSVILPSVPAGDNVSIVGNRSWWTRFLQSSLLPLKTHSNTHTQQSSRVYLSTCHVCAFTQQSCFSGFIVSQPRDSYWGWGEANTQVSVWAERRLKFGWSCTAALRINKQIQTTYMLQF